MKSAPHLKVEADWRKLIMANYAVNKKLLEPFVPYGTQLDYWGDQCYVSLVGFLFLKSKLNGIPIPFHAVFEEVNLRFYVVRHEGDVSKRGVVFVRELVPKSSVTFIANTIFHEHYETLPMQHEHAHKVNQQTVGYSWRKDTWNKLSIVSGTIARSLIPGSKEEFFTEHYWGYTKLHDRCTLEYFVNHHPWETYDTQSYSVDVDFGKNYGSVFSFLSGLKPDSVFLAEGSAISLEKSKKIVQVTSAQSRLP